MSELVLAGPTEFERDTAVEPMGDGRVGARISSAWRARIRSWK